jgi:hypothetical protein
MMPVQKDLVERLVNYSLANDIGFSAKVLKYLLDEIQTSKQISELNDRSPADILGQILDTYERVETRGRLFGKKTLNRVVNAMGGCPKPWC